MRPRLRDSGSAGRLFAVADEARGQGTGFCASWYYIALMPPATALQSLQACNVPNHVESVTGDDCAVEAREAHILCQLAAILVTIETFAYTPRLQPATTSATDPLFLAPNLHSLSILLSRGTAAMLGLLA